MMQVIVPGHVYEVSNVEDTEATQRLLFIEKEQSPSAAGQKLQVVRDGTTTEQVLEVVVDRLRTLQSRLPDDAKYKAITCIDEALVLLEQRRADRASRGVLGTHLS